MHPSKRLTYLTMVRHRSSLPSKPSLLLHKVCHWVIVFQKFTIDEFAKELSLFLILINSAAEDIPSADPADPHQSTIKTMSSSQRQEIALKQVSYLT
jgi:hypothetical protein